MKTILITGGAGFVGINLLKRMLAQNYAGQYIVIDNFMTGNKRQLETFLAKKKCHVDVIAADICTFDFKTLHNKYAHIDEIFHLASLASPPVYKRYPMETLDVGYIGTKNVLELCKHYTTATHRCKILYTSTSEVYGDAQQHPQTESYYGNVNPYGERSCYDVSKRIAETLLYTYKHHHDVDTRIVRIFNTYGPFMSISDGRIVTEIVRCMLLGTTLNIFGNGRQTRSLNYVDDTVDMMLNVMQSEYSNPVNIGNEHEVSVSELVQVAKGVYEQHFKKPCKLICKHTTIDKDDPKVRRPDLMLYKSMFGEPKGVPLEQGLHKTMLFFLEHIDIPDDVSTE